MEEFDINKLTDKERKKHEKMLAKWKRDEEREKRRAAKDPFRGIWFAISINTILILYLFSTR